MIDATLAATPPKPDLKIQLKQGGKSDKGTVGDDKASFRNALNERLIERHPAGERKAGDGAEDLPLADTDLPPDTAPVADTTSQPAAPVKKPLILIAAARQRETVATDDSVRNADKPDTNRGLEREMVAREIGLGKKEADVSGDESDVDVQAQDVDTPAESKHVKRAHGERKTEEPADLPAAETVTDAPAKDALGLLKETAPASPNTAHRSADGSRNAEADQEPDANPEARGSSYRVSRTDGRGQSVDVETAVDKAGVKDAMPKAGSVENVLVVDQRRFLAPALDNTRTIVGGIAGDSEWAQALQPGQSLANAAAQAGSGKVVNMLKLQLHPIELGLVTATLRLSGDELSVELKVDTGVAYRNLKEDQARIVEALKAHGFAVDQVNISFGAERSEGQGANAQNGQSSNFAQQQQQARDGGQDAPTARSRQRNQREGYDNGAATIDETSGNGSAGTRRPGHVYL